MGKNWQTIEEVIHRWGNPKTSKRKKRALIFLVRKEMQIKTTVRSLPYRSPLAKFKSLENTVVGEKAQPQELSYHVLLRPQLVPPSIQEEDVSSVQCPEVPHQGASHSLSAHAHQQPRRTDPNPKTRAQEPYCLSRVTITQWIVVCIYLKWIKYSWAQQQGWISGRGEGRKAQNTTSILCNSHEVPKVGRTGQCVQGCTVGTIVSKSMNFFSSHRPGDGDLGKEREGHNYREHTKDCWAVLALSVVYLLPFLGCSKVGGAGWGVRAGRQEQCFEWQGQYIPRASA